MSSIIKKLLNREKGKQEKPKEKPTVNYPCVLDIFKSNYVYFKEEAPNKEVTYFLQPEKSDYGEMVNVDTLKELAEEIFSYTDEREFLRPQDRLSHVSLNFKIIKDLNDVELVDSDKTDSFISMNENLSKEERDELINALKELYEKKIF